MPTKSEINVQRAKNLASVSGYQQIIIFGHAQECGTVITTWGETAELSAQAAAGANHIKKQWGWPEDTIVESAKVQALKDRITELEAQIADCVYEVHVIEGTEYERGWGQRPDGHYAFLTEAAARKWIAEYNNAHNNRVVVPVEYTTYSYIGIKTCSYSFLQKVRDKQAVYFNRIKELQA